ncbi:ImmA/IrrE family metallo-endopeptidase [Clostridium sardiniense]|uniref:ImmA/IrrE family metallo-endopeptidase n=1 Tax=Clostridium sardiniense TaxID=29369 RepID=A0ABS7L2R2_CLOSR|nr:ImmA/IrrE family metallo-endopeptidase [Clostridium sardiniense]MBY0757158.1 ImmA/IrrE family metallo-endopeptidase [Clostridium sardiniense]MDQ0461668.1 putative nucleotidyltransferase [Clostridium sardiniense]
MKNYRKKTEEERKKEVDILIENAEKKIEKYFDNPEQIKELSEFMSKFYNYSLRNSTLIDKQFKGAIAVGSYAFWKSKGFQVNKGEKGIKILVPTKLGDRFINGNGETILISKASEREKDLIKKGELELKEGKIVFNQGYVFDISQTNAKSSDLPKIFPNRWLDGEVKDYKTMYKGLERIAEKNGIRIIAPKRELGVVKGVSYTSTKEVALNPRNTEIHNAKTLIHELAHAKIHDLENNDKYSKNEKEFQAELTAYTVSKYFGIDTSEYSFRYIKSWTKDTELKDKINLVEEVRETSKEFVETIEYELIKEKEKIIENQKELLVKEKEANNSFFDTKKVDYYNKDKLKEIPIKEVCERLGLELKRGSSKRLWTKIRNEKSSSCCINLDKNYWYDYGIGKGGDTIKLIEEVRGVNSKSAMKELAEMFGIEGEEIKNNFYISKDDYKLIGIEPDRATLNLDINLEKQSLEELEQIDEVYGKSMNELANTNKEKFIDIIKEKSLPILIGDKNKLEVLKERLVDEIKVSGENSKDSIIYYGMLETLSTKVNKRVDIVKKIGLNKELRENYIDKVSENSIYEYKEKSTETDIGQVKILKSENAYFRENEIMSFKEANKIFQEEEKKIADIKKDYEKKGKYYPYEKVRGEIKISEKRNLEFRYDIGCGDFYNLADLLERELSNTNNQYEVKEFLIEQEVRVNNKEEKEIDFLNDNFNYQKNKIKDKEKDFEWI